MSLAQVQKIERNYTKNKSIHFKSLMVIVTTFIFSMRKKNETHRRLQLLPFLFSTKAWNWSLNKDPVTSVTSNITDSAE